MPPLESKSSNANPPIESKTAKKKKAKAEVAQSQPPPASTESEVGARRDSADGAVNGADGTYESPYIKELQKCADVTRWRDSRTRANFSCPTETSATLKRSWLAASLRDTLFQD